MALICMFKKVRVFLLPLVLFAISTASSTVWAAGSSGKYLGVVDIENVSGLKGVQAVARMTLPGAGGDLNFATKNKNMLLMVQITDMRNFAEFKKAYFQKEVKGVGEEAFQGTVVPGAPPSFLAFRKGNTCFTLTGFQDYTTQKNLLTIDQITALGKLIASRH